VTAPATLNPAPRTCTSRRIGVVRHVRGGGEGQAGGGGGAQIGEEDGGQGSGRRGGCIFIRQGAFLTMEHLLAMMVSVPPSPGRMHIHSARGIQTMEHLLVTMVSLPASTLSVGQATIIFFYIGF
jgi:hypothetical protein